MIVITEKPNLFSDFYRDLSHLGAQRDIVPLIVNLKTPIKDTERGNVLLYPSRPGDVQRALAADDLPPGVNLVLVTYSQLCQAVSPKTDGLCRIAQRTGAQILVDESHNASGESTTAVNVGRLIAVSYTHLDVYKRQGINRPSAVVAKYSGSGGFNSIQTFPNTLITSAMPSTRLPNLSLIHI